MIKLLKSVLVIVLVSAMTMGARAATIEINAAVVSAFDLSFSDIPMPDLTTNHGIPAVYQVDLTASVSNLAPGEAGFANVGFNIFLSSNLVDVAGWTPYTNTVDSNGPAPGGIVPLWSVNVDGGVPGDLKGILVSIPGGVTSPNDPRRTVGQPGGVEAFLGSVFVQWDGAAYATLSVQDILTSVNTTTGQFVDNGPAHPVQLTFGSAGPNIPEPTSLVLMGSCFAGWLLRRRG